MTSIVEEDGESLAEKMQGIIDRLPPGGVTLVEIRDLIGREGMMLMTAFLTIVFLVPVSIPGVSTVFGGAILLLSFGRLMNRPVWLPDRLKRRPVSSEKLRAAMERGLRLFRRLERISRPRRMRWMASGRVAAVVNNVALIAGAVLLMAPFGLIPFSNTLPAMAILLLAIGMLQRDGGCILLGHLMNVATVVYFGVLIGGGAAVIQRGVEKVM